MTIECVSLETNHLFAGNPIAEQHRLRYRSIIKRQGWGVPQVRDLEYDQYDNPAALYLIWRDSAGVARGSSRLYPTDRPFMLKEHFSFMTAESRIPEGPTVWEGSRFCIDNTIASDLRQRIARELILAYLEHGLRHGITQYIGIMYPIYWRHLFEDVGWRPFWLGEAAFTSDGKKSRAGSVAVTHENLQTVRHITNLHHSVVIYREPQGEAHVRAA